MRENIYLNEERYKKTKKHIKIAGLFIIMIGFVLIMFGALKIGQANSIQVPDMMESNWFEQSSLKHSTEFSGIAMTMFGSFIMVNGFIVTFFIGNSREITAYSIQSMMPLAQEGIKTMAPTMVEVQKYGMKEMTPAFKDMMKEMTPVYGEMAKEISKGIKEGLNK